MLEKVNFEDDVQEQSQAHLLRPAYYWQLVKRRWPYFLVPFVLIAVLGGTGLYFWPATYLSEGKILVQSQLIPTELVRPTVTSAAQERIQAIQQRTMTRDNLLEIVDKFKLFPKQRSLLSVTDLVDLMKNSTKIEPVEQELAFSKQPARGEIPTIAFTVGFEYPDPQGATQVANELVTRILSEDLRDRTSRARDTTKFLAREVQRLQAENATIEAKVLQAKIAQGKPTTPTTPNTPDQSAVQLAQMRAELTQKSAIYSDRHPIMQALKRQIEAMEKIVSQPPAQVGPDAPVGIDVLEAQQEAVQKNLDAASTKLAAARLGETLEKDQQSERLEVIEQPTLPQQPIRPKRLKISAVILTLSLMAGGGIAFAAEMMDKGIRRGSQLFGVVDSRIVLSIPYITTKAEVQARKRRVLGTTIASLVVLISVIAAAYFFLPPLDVMIAKARAGLYSSPSSSTSSNPTRR